MGYPGRQRVPPRVVAALVTVAAMPADEAARWLVAMAAESAPAALAGAWALAVDAVGGLPVEPAGEPASRPPMLGG